MNVVQRVPRPCGPFRLLDVGDVFSPKEQPYLFFMKVRGAVRPPKQKAIPSNAVLVGVTNNDDPAEPEEGETRGFGPEAQVVRFPRAELHVGLPESFHNDGECVGEEEER